MYTAESTGASMERTKMPNVRNGSKWRFEPGLTLLRVRHSTTELPRSTCLKHNKVIDIRINSSTLIYTLNIVVEQSYIY